MSPHVFDPTSNLAFYLKVTSLLFVRPINPPYTPNYPHHYHENRFSLCVFVTELIIVSLPDRKYSWQLRTDCYCLIDCYFRSAFVRLTNFDECAY